MRKPRKCTCGHVHKPRPRTEPTLIVKAYWAIGVDAVRQS